MDINAFLNASLNLREATIEVPQLADFFGDEPAEWTIRGLTAAEMAKANEAGESGSNIRAIVDTLAKGEKAEAIKNLRVSSMMMFRKMYHAEFKCWCPGRCHLSWTRTQEMLRFDWQELSLRFFTI
jgi:hypothetical protein